MGSFIPRTKKVKELKLDARFPSGYVTEQGMYTYSITLDNIDKRYIPIAVYSTSNDNWFNITSYVYNENSILINIVLPDDLEGETIDLIRVLPL